MHHEYRLDNGLQLVTVPIPGSRSVSMGVFVRLGSRYENEAQAGMSHFIEHMLFKGTTHRPTARLIAEAIEGVGGDSNAYTEQELTVYYAKIAASQAGVALNVLADLVRHPLFEPQEIEKERYIIGEELDMAYDSPDDWVHVLADQLMWPDHPLGRNILGTASSLAGLQREPLLSFYAGAYHPQNILVALGGAVEPEQVFTEVESLLGDWRPAARPEFQPAPAPQTAPRWYVEERPLEQGHLCLTLPGLPRNHPDRYALALLNAVLGEGMSSRLFLTIREEKGLAYMVESGLNMLQDTGSFTIYAGVDPERAPEALQAVLDELERLRQEPIPEKELNKVKEYLKGRLVLGLEDSFHRTAWLAYQTLFLGQVKTVEAVLAAYEAVTAAAVQAVAQQILNPAGYNLAAVGPFPDGQKLGRIITL